MANGELAHFYSAYIERVVNQHDMVAVDDMVSPDYVGGGHGVAVRAFAGGQVANNEDGSPQPPPFLTSVEWLATVRVVDRMIVEIRLVSWADLSE